MTLARCAPAVVVLAAALAAAACGRGDRSAERAKAPSAVFTHRDSVLPLGDGDVRIVNTDSSVELALVGQRIVMRFADKTIAKIRAKTDTSTVKDSGFSGSLERLVKGTVQKALEQQAEYPLSAVREARYENGEIVLDVGGGTPKLFQQTKVDNKPVMKTFAPADAERFVAAVKARKSQNI